MPGAARVGIDAAGDVIAGPGVPSVLVDGAPVSVIGDKVNGHGRRKHSDPVMETGSPTVSAGGKPVCRAGDTATCGHATSGSATVSIG